jgi:hypothetical protein
MLLHTGSIACTCAYCCMGIIPQPANAYENRNVGGDDASPETKAMNRQAYETNNRLERDGFKLDVSYRARVPFRLMSCSNFFHFFGV